MGADGCCKLPSQPASPLLALGGRSCSHVWASMPRWEPPQR